MSDLLLDTAQTSPLRLRLISVEAWSGLEGEARDQAARQGFDGKVGKLAFVASDEVWAGIGPEARVDPFVSRGLAARLPAGDHQLAEPPAGLDLQLFALGWALGGHVFDRYKARPQAGQARLVLPETEDRAAVRRTAAACALVREMIDTPAADMGPLQIETIAREIAEAHGAAFEVTTGDDLLERNYPAVHAVGRAAAPHRAPRLIEIGWRLDRADLPLVALVGKGVVFDSGGLDIKPAAGMRWMKKDMGGAAHALGLARLVMQAELPVRLVVLVAAVENAISGDAFRPGDVLPSRKGLTIEVGNTDAEGRVILSDALTRAGEHRPDLTVDFATLTGAARVAVGPELAPFYTADAGLAEALKAAAVAERDPVWQMPLWPGYREAIDSDIADIRNDSAEWAQAGSVTAALFLERFAPATGSWCHFDIFAWNGRSRPGWPQGGEVQGLRAVFRVLSDRYGR